MPRQSIGAPARAMSVNPLRTYADLAGLYGYVDTSVSDFRRSPCLAARDCATVEPRDHPRTWNLSRPRASATARTSSAMSAMENAPSHSVSPDPRLSMVTARRPPRTGSMPSQDSEDAPSPAMRSTGSPSPCDSKRTLAPSDSANMGGQWPRG